jgi:hypothetical protein
MVEVDVRIAQQALTLIAVREQLVAIIAQLEDTVDAETPRVVTVLREDTRIAAVAQVALTVLTASMHQEEGMETASHALLEDTRVEVMAPVQTAQLVDLPEPVLAVVLTVLLVHTPEPGLVRAPSVPLVGTLHVDGARAGPALPEGTQVAALVDARTALTASIRRLLADPRV